MVNFDTREGIMKEWDAWVRYYRSGGGGTWARDAFESLLDYFDEQIKQLSDKSSGKPKEPPCACNCTPERYCKIHGGGKPPTPERR